MKTKPIWRVTYILGVAAVAFLLGRRDFTLTVYGANFVEGAVVNWNGSPR
jgi:hypothetical protein